MAKISVVINVVDEEINFLPRAIASIVDLAGEIIIVDMTTGDISKTLKSKGIIKIFKHERIAYVELIRNFGISKAKFEWVLIVDPDEIIGPDLKSRLKKIIDNPKVDYYRLPRKNIIFGKWIKHSRWWPDYNIRFFRKGAVAWSEIIHAVPLTEGNGADLEAKEENAILHHNYQSIEQYIERMNRYTTQQAKFLAKDNYSFSWGDLFKKPSGEFLSRYFQGEGYKDGLHGLALALLQSFSELIVYLKVWQEKKFVEKDLNVRDVVQKMNGVESEIHYWQADTLVKEVGGMKYRLKRRFRLPWIRNLF